MITASKLAGFFAAHAVWCVSDGETLIPMLAYTIAEATEEKRMMDRLVVQDDLAASVTYGKSRLEGNEMDANDAALFYDSRITLGAEKVDAIIIEMRAYFSPGSEAVMAIPYTPKTSGAFKLLRPKILAWKNCEDFDVNTAMQSFFDGVDEHEKGRKIWADCLDESR